MKEIPSPGSDLRAGEITSTARRTQQSCDRGSFLPGKGKVLIESYRKKAALRIRQTPESHHGAGLNNGQAFQVTWV